MSFMDELMQNKAFAEATKNPEFMAMKNVTKDVPMNVNSIEAKNINTPTLASFKNNNLLLIGVAVVGLILLLRKK